MIMRTENAVAAVNTALSPAIKPPKGRRVMVGPAIGPASNTLMGLQSVSRDGDAGIQTNGKTYVVAPRLTTPRFHRAGMLRSTFDDANALDKFSQTRSGPVLRTSARGASGCGRYSPRTNRL
ncbi:iron-sulfur cluster assembly accessory protein [Mesorhizobium sp. M0586]|uniref:iron-sulfur cluster assembly accessory protein n=1 Tax=unclassified Mesorhizobium TaxID=325217 RepID=UPI003339AD77